MLRSAATVLNSTISHNQAHNVAGGIQVIAFRSYFFNSTIAFNQADSSAANATGGILLIYGTAADAVLHSMLIANNTAGSPAVAADLNVQQGPITFSGSNNLVRASTALLPLDTITGVCPLLGPLRDNGGPTLTHALQSGSPAIDTGDNVWAGPQLLDYDQRDAPFVRTSGATDIGAYELQQDDIIFASGFDGC